MVLKFHWEKGMKIYMLVDASKRKDGVKELWKIKDLAKATGDVITSHILFIHAWSGCDTTFAMYGLDKFSENIINN